MTCPTKTQIQRQRQRHLENIVLEEQLKYSTDSQFRRNYSPGNCSDWSPDRNRRDTDLQYKCNKQYNGRQLHRKSDVTSRFRLAERAQCRLQPTNIIYVI